MNRFHRLISFSSKFQSKFILKELYLTRLYSINSKPNSISSVPRLNAILLQKRNLNQDTNAAGVWDPFPDPFQPIVEYSAETALGDDDDEKSDPKKKRRLAGKSGAKPPPPPPQPKLSPRVMDAVLTTVMGLAAVGLGGVFYQAWYEWNEKHKVMLAFTKPAPLLRSRTSESYFARDEQKKIAKVVAGHGNAKYYLLVGEKGTGKTQLVLNAMEKVGHYGVIFCEAHSDSEVFKTRLGKALNYTYREDYVGQLFAREAPERGSALLDVEKALNMVEVVAIKYSRRRGRPLILIINNIHSFKEDEDGEDLLELLQQRAESWAASRLVTMVFNTDDYSVYERMKRDASRMDTIRVGELSHEEAIRLLKERRRGREPDEEIEDIIKNRIGGRLSFVNRVGREESVIDTVKMLESEERSWIVSQIGLIPDFEETAFDDQKYASCAWKLIRALVKSEEKQLPLNKCRIITGNPKWIEMLDHDNILMIDDHHNVKADSKILQNIFEEMVNEEDFDETLDNVCERVEEVDKEQRTRELIWSKKNDQVVRFGKPKKEGLFW